MQMKIVYIAHPIGGDVEGNLKRIREIVLSINQSNPNVVPFVPYYADVVSMDDSNPEHRKRGIRNDMAILSRKGMVDEMWLFGHTISNGMRQEVYTALHFKIPIVASTSELHRELEALKSNYQKSNP